MVSIQVRIYDQLPTGTAGALARNAAQGNPLYGLLRLHMVVFLRRSAGEGARGPSNELIVDSS
jgi:hypothetical protein